VDRGDHLEIVGRFSWEGGKKPTVKELRKTYAAEMRRYADMLGGNDGWARGGDSVGRETRADSLVLGKESG